MASFRFVGRTVFVFLGFVLLSHCSSASSNKVISNLSELPDIDLTSIDTTASLSPLPALTTVLADEGASSTVGCYCQNLFKPLSLAIAKTSQAPFCYLKTAQAAAGTDVLSIPKTGTDESNETSYAYYIIDDMRVRIGNFTSGGVTTLKGDVCNILDAETGMEQTTSFDVSGNTGTKTWNVDLVHHSLDTASQDRFFVASNVAILMDSASAMSEAFSFANVATVASTNYYGNTPTTDDVVSGSTSYDGTSSLSFNLDSNGDNSLLVANLDGSGASFQQQCLFDASSGAGLFDLTDGADVYEFTEPFSIADTPLITASNSFATSLSSSALPTAMTAAIANANLNFTRTWDCLDASGGTNGFKAIDSSADYTSCAVLITETTSLLDTSVTGGEACSVLLEAAIADTLGESGGNNGGVNEDGSCDESEISTPDTFVGDGTGSETCSGFFSSASYDTDPFIPACYGFGDGNYCTHTCTADADCAQLQSNLYANRALVCLTIDADLGAKLCRPN